MAAKDIRGLPKLEGTAHVNMALIIKFMNNYFFEPNSSLPVVPKIDDFKNDDFLLIRELLLKVLKNYIQRL